VRNAALAQTLREGVAAIRVLIKGCESFEIVDDESQVPVGCVGESISSEVSAHLLLKVSLEKLFRRVS
jgi:valyl-tRNA synthetase